MNKYFFLVIKRRIKKNHNSQKSNIILSATPNRKCSTWENSTVSFFLLCKTLKVILASKVSPHLVLSTALTSLSLHPRRYLKEIPSFFFSSAEKLFLESITSSVKDFHVAKKAAALWALLSVVHQLLLDSCCHQPCIVLLQERVH